MEDDKLVTADGAQRLGGGAEQQTVDKRIVLVGDGRNGLRKREDEVKVLSLEEFGAAILQPLRSIQLLAAGACLSRQLLKVMGRWPH